MSVARAKPEMVHVPSLLVTHVRPLIVIVAPLMPVVVKVTDRVNAVSTMRVIAVAVVRLSVIVRLVCVTYPVLDAV